MLIRNIADVNHEPMDVPGADGVKMLIMAGRADQAPNFAMRHIVIDAGGHSPRHSHDYEHEVYVVDGGGTVLLEGGERAIRRGDVVFVPPDEEHQFRAGQDGLSFLCLVPVTRDCGECTPGS